MSNLVKPFIIAEVGNNHEGRFEIAKKLILKASQAGVDAIKFQTFITEKFINKEDINRFKQLKKFELSHKQFLTLKKLANKKNLKFISTPLDISSANFLAKNADIIKIASGDNNFFPLLDIVLKSNKPIIISTGMTNNQNIKSLINYIIYSLSMAKCCLIFSNTFVAVPQTEIRVSYITDISSLFVKAILIIESSSCG